MTQEEAKVGTIVKTNVEFPAIAKGTCGVIDQYYPTGVMVAWDLPDQPLPPGYRIFDGRPAIVSKILRDGFSWDELKYLDKA